MGNTSKPACVVNVEMRCYRESVVRGLVADGYTVIDADDSDPDQTKEIVKEVKTASRELYTDECQGVSNSEDASDTELKKLKNEQIGMFWTLPIVALVCPRFKA